MRFPNNFRFQLIQSEKEEVVTNCDHLTKLKFSYILPYAFTEQGVAMLSAILRSETAVKNKYSNNGSICKNEKSCIRDFFSFK